ncbi:MAG: SUF system Fe-S cluster assembly protein [Rhizobiales bacterium]|nr:SUF system Fe-S cluster assembly protein [Hyphomicrobiales bacterium]
MTEDINLEKTDVAEAATESTDTATQADTGQPAPCVETIESIRESSATGETDERFEQMTADIVAAIKTVHDPEIPVDIYELGLIYRVDIDEGSNVTVDMTLTAPGCPVAGEMPIWVENAVSGVEGVQGVVVNMVFDPPWDMSRLSELARIELNMF